MIHKDTEFRLLSTQIHPITNSNPYMETISLSEAQLRRIPPHCCSPPNDDDSSSLSEFETPLTIPDNASVNYVVVDDTPGLSIATKRTPQFPPEPGLELRILLLNHACLRLAFGYSCILCVQRKNYYRKITSINGHV